MRISDFARPALGIGGAVALLSGCGGSQVGSLPRVSVGAAGTVEPSSHGLYKLKWYDGVGPPYSVRTKVRYFRGTVPVVLAGYNYPGGNLALTFALLDHTDSRGNYALYDYGVNGSGPVWLFSGVYMSSIVLDIGYNNYGWGSLRMARSGATPQTSNGLATSTTLQALRCAIRRSQIQKVTFLPPPANRKRTDPQLGGLPDRLLCFMIHRNGGPTGLGTKRAGALSR